MIVSGNLVDAFVGRIYPAEITIEDGVIRKIVEVETADKQYIMPGFVDSHIHIESTMLRPSLFGKAAIQHGTIAAVCDPHEIANVLGVDGIDFMIEDSKKSPVKLFFGLPSCVPATTFETSGAAIDAKQTAELLKRKDILFLAEMMNYPGVVYEDKETLAKVAAAKNARKPCDGHAPLLSGNALKKYVNAGITTDHECSNLHEAEEKIALGMKILIREGSAARNFDALKSLVDKYPNDVMFCTDDCHPDELQNHHINHLAEKSMQNGYSIYNVVKSSSINPVLHYNLPVGLLRKNDPADFIVVENLENFKLKDVYVNGKNVLKKQYTSNENVVEDNFPNKFARRQICLSDIELVANGKKLKIIKVVDGDLLTDKLIADVKTEKGKLVSDTDQDFLKIVVASRYDNSKPSVGFISGFGLKCGAIACSIAHDSHNVVAIGSSDEKILRAINMVIEGKGGMSAVAEKEEMFISLPIAGLMTNESCEKISGEYEKINTFAKKMGSNLKAPFMTMAFMPLLVIPKLKISDKGLFDGDIFAFTAIFDD